MYADNSSVLFIYMQIFHSSSLGAFLFHHTLIEDEQNEKLEESDGPGQLTSK